MKIQKKGTIQNLTGRPQINAKHMDLQQHQLALTTTSKLNKKNLMNPTNENFQ